MLTPMLLKFVLVKLNLLVVKRKDFKGRKPAVGGMMRPGYKSGGAVKTGCGKVMSKRRKKNSKVY